MVNATVFRRGFRSFFLLSGLYGCLGMLVWLAVLSTPSLAQTLFPADGSLASYEWHSHEMLFGYAVAVMAGFLLTAVPNWTGSAPPAGKPIFLLSAVWLLGRAAVWLQAWLPAWLTALADLSFLPFLALMVGSRLLRQPEGRNKIFLLLLALLWAAQIMTHLGHLGTSSLAHQGRMLALDTIILLIVIVGGRIVPSFTLGWLRMNGKMQVIQPLRWLEIAALASAALVLAADQLPLPEPVLGFGFLAAGVIHAARVARWKGQLTGAAPIVWILHLGYSWLALGFLVRGLSHLSTPLSETAALHAHTIGAIGSMTLAVMTRAALGHSGRPIKAFPAITLSYALVSAAAVIRVLGPVAAPGQYEVELLLAGLLWALAFGIFTAVYLPILTKPRADGSDG